jgi:hypothetical protein
MVANVYWGKGMKRRQIYEILKHVKYRKILHDQRHFKPTKSVHAGQINTYVVATIKFYRRIYIKLVGEVHMTSFGTISLILHPTQRAGPGKEVYPWGVKRAVLGAE